MSNVAAKGNSLARGTSVMVICVTIAKILGIIWIVPLTRLIHDEGMGIYSNAYSLYIFVLTFSTAGFPTAMGKLIAERLALKRYGDVEQLYKLTIRIVVSLGIFLFLVMWFGAPLFSRLVAVKESAQAVSSLTLSIRALAPALLVVPLMSALRGYLQGFQKLEPSAYSQAVEQFARVFTIVVGAYIVMKAGGTIAAGAAAATFGAFVGAIAGLALLMFAVVPLRRKFRLQASKFKSAAPSRTLTKALWNYALPVSLGSVPVPISTMVDTLTITNFLMLAGYSFHDATTAYGIFSRQAMQLIQLPLAFAMALGVSVLPAIAEAAALRNQAAIEARVSATIRSTLFMTFPVGATLFMLGAPIDQIISGKTEGAAIISSVAFMGIFSGLELISTYMLQGLGKMYRPVRNMFIGIAFKLVLNILLILPFHAIGAAIATSLGYLLSATLNVLAVKKYAKVKFSVWKLSMPLIASTLICCIGLALGSQLVRPLVSVLTSSPDVRATVQVIFGIAVGGIFYVVPCLYLGAVSSSELQRIPVIGRRLSPFAARLQRRRTA